MIHANDAWLEEKCAACGHPLGLHTYRNVDETREDGWMPHCPEGGAERMMACTCYWTDPSTWSYHYGIPEPGSTMEWNPDCPQHGDTPIERETAFALGRWPTGIPIPDVTPRNPT